MKAIFGKIQRRTNNTMGVSTYTSNSYEMRVQGFEPWTYGLKGRCSTD